MSTSLVSLASLLERYEPLTPQLRVAAVIARGRQYLLVEHRKRGQLYWVLPGGRLEPGETLHEAVRRELEEELGLLEVRVGPLLAVYETLAPERHTVNLAFLVDIGAQAPQVNQNDPVLSSCRWIDVEQLDRLDLRPPIGAALVEMLAGEFRGQVRFLGDTWTPADH